MLKKLMIKSTLLGLVLLPAAVLRADVFTYTYIGNHFSTFTGTPGVSTSDRMSISLTFASALADNLNYADESGLVTAWSISAGGWTIPPGSLGSLRLSTDSSGNIIGPWYIEAEFHKTGEGLLMYSAVSHPGDVEDYIQTTTYSDNGTPTTGTGSAPNNPGTWTDPVAPVPEPGYLGFASTAFAGLMLVWRHRKQRA